MDNNILLGALAGLVAIAGYLLSQRDNKQGKEIDLLFKKHDENEKALMNLRIQIAEQHYPKKELDDKFAALNSTIKNGFEKLDESMKEMSRSFTSHLTEHAKKDGQ